MQINDVHYSDTFKIESVQVTGDWADSKAYNQVFKTNVETALNAMAEAILARAKMTVPKKNGYLSDSGHVAGTGLERQVIFGNSSVPYAAYQERGMRADGTYVVRHYTTPGTGSRYLQNAFESVLKEGLRRFLK